MVDGGEQGFAIDLDTNGSIGLQSQIHQFIKRGGIVENAFEDDHGTPLGKRKVGDRLFSKCVDDSLTNALTQAIIVIFTIEANALRRK